ncbi:hypothetical protein QTJ16_006422 [Diplocarpon rosae]|uniref:DNA repair protein rhp42 n=1 Tax=Diplocarpon rosae TaxID=946125 RepID=A0AAD9SWT6_9HELO|nr:hypothetical protein QTJ16_006422 [Diplocarpon rosae]PBP28007.1 Rad4 family protein [Diplocarpon rosae]
MPPFLPRKRLRSNSPEAGPSKPPLRKGAKPKRTTTTTPRRPTLFDDLDAGTGSKRSVENKNALLKQLAGVSSDDDSSLSSLSEQDFEDVPFAKRQKTNDEDEEEEDEQIEFEDVETNPLPRPVGLEPSGDLELVLRRDERVSITNPLGSKKGPSKIERGIRVATHQIHVMMLMYHNAIRNAWCCDKELQDILVKQLPPKVALAVKKWRHDSGLDPPTRNTPTKRKGKGISQATKGKISESRNQRDWGEPAQRLAEGEINMSAGDPIFALIKILMAYWRKRFVIRLPGLRKLGYMSLQRLDEEIKSFKEEEYDPERHGERIRDLKEFRKCAEVMEGSRDVGSQLFTALLRGLGIEARLVANLQPVGFGWSQVEEAAEKNPRILKSEKSVEIADHASDEEISPGENDEAVSRPTKKGKGRTTAKSTLPPKSTAKSGTRAARGSGVKDAPIHLSESEDLAIDDDEVEDVTSTFRPAKRQPLAYDRDLVHPHYWTEVLSPVTNMYTPVDPIVLHIHATNPALLERFETRGAKSEKAKQVTAYIVGHSPDGTAKDVTTRYLKRHVWPGRTKGNRFPVEKIPIYNRYGKVKRYEQKDWFKEVMSGYIRGSKKYPRTDIDDQEEATDLKPVKAEKKEIEEGKETLQYYKTSPDFVLERHLKREEALLPEAEHVKMFIVKGRGEASTEEKVFRRKDVVSCKTMETWHKEGRAPKMGEVPLKRVPYRAATTNRRRELAEAEHASGEKVLQGLFSREQTDWIIPPPIENGIIPKNSFGNIDLYVDSMLPAGAVHIPLRATVKICKKLEIDYAEAVVGFEFGHRMAVPIISGVVVAEEHHDAVMEQWHQDEAERVRKEDEKSRKLVLHTWRKMLMGLRIVERVREEFGDADENADVLNPWMGKKKLIAVDDMEAEARKRIMDRNDEEMAGGFLPEGFDAGEPDPQRQESFFPVAPEDNDEDLVGGFIVEGHDDEPEKARVGRAYVTPQSPDIASKEDIHEYSGDIEDEHSGVDIKAPAPVPKKRGRPAGSANAIHKATIKKTGKRPAPQKKDKAKQKRLIQDTEKEEDDEVSALSVPPSDDVESNFEEASTKKRGRRAALPIKSAESVRKTPRRQAARKSETALKSHYFEHSDDEDD